MANAVELTGLQSLFDISNTDLCEQIICQLGVPSAGTTPLKICHIVALASSRLRELVKLVLSAVWKARQELGLQNLEEIIKERVGLSPYIVGLFPYWLRDMTPLIHASAKGGDARVEKLIVAGADINARDRIEGFTPLMAACHGGHRDTVRVLLAAGADYNLRRLSDTASGTGETALIDSILGAHYEVVKQLVEAKADVEAGCHQHGPPVIVAIRIQSREILDLLLQAGASANALDPGGDTALVVAHRHKKRNGWAIGLLKAAQRQRGHPPCLSRPCACEGIPQV